MKRVALAGGISVILAFGFVEPASAQQPPSHRPSMPPAESRNGSNLGDVLWGAFIGGVLAIGGDVGVRMVFERRRFASIRESLIAEVTIIREEADARLTPERTAGLSLQPPLPTAVWELSLATGIASRFNKGARDSLFGLYRAVEGANYLATQAPLFWATATSAAGTDSQDVAPLLEEKARELATEPHKQVAALARRVERLLQR